LEGELPRQIGELEWARMKANGVEELKKKFRGWQLKAEVGR